MNIQKAYLQEHPLEHDLRQLPLFSAREASLELGRSASYIRQLYNNYPERLLQGTVAKIGNVLIISQEGIDFLRATRPQAAGDSLNGYLEEDLVGSYFKIDDAEMSGNLRVNGIPYAYTVIANEAMPTGEGQPIFTQIRKVNGSELLVAIVNESEVVEDQIIYPRFVHLEK